MPENLTVMQTVCLRRQYEEIKATLPNEAPKTFAGFVKMKSAKSERYKELLQDYKAVIGIAKSAESGIMKLEKTNTFNSKADPMYEVMGSAFDSHPNEIKEIIEQLNDWGIEVNYGSSTLGYGCIRMGQPGVLSITENASYSAWLHEFQHVKDDKAAGWDGAMVLFCNPKERERRERNAYAIEISLAKELGRDDIVKRLEANLDEEIKQIYKKAEEY